MNEAMMPDETKRGPGRPPKAEAAPVKKGKPTWKPANIDEVINKEPGYRYRKINKDPRNMAKKLAEGWEVVSDMAGQNTTMEQGYGRINDGKPLTTAREGYDYLIARIPEETAQERDAYINNESSRRVAGLKRQTQEDLRNSDAPVHGSISMEKRGVRTIIKE